MFLAGYLLVVALLGSAHAQIFSMGNCDSHSRTVPDYDTSKYLGQWYEYKRTDNVFEKPTKCFNFLSTDSGDSSFKILGTWAYRHDVSTPKTRLYTSVYDDVKGLWQHSPGLIGDSQLFQIIATDYENYGIEYSCMDAYNGKLEMYWIVTRTPKPDDVIVAMINNVLEERNIQVEWITEEQDCDWINNV